MASLQQQLDAITKRVGVLETKVAAIPAGGSTVAFGVFGAQLAKSATALDAATLIGIVVGTAQDDIPTWDATAKRWQPKTPAHVAATFPESTTWGV